MHVIGKFCGWLCCGLVLPLLFIGFGAVGCQKVEMKKMDMKSGTPKADQDKIQGYLEAAGVKGKVITITDNGTSWLVEVVPPPATEGKKGRGAGGALEPPSYQVDKTSGKVSGSAGAGL